MTIEELLKRERTDIRFLRGYINTVYKMVRYGHGYEDFEEDTKHAKKILERMEMK